MKTLRFGLFESQIQKKEIFMEHFGADEAAWTDFQEQVKTGIVSEYKNSVLEFINDLGNSSSYETWRMFNEDFESFMNTALAKIQEVSALPSFDNADGFERMDYLGAAVATGFESAFFVALCDINRPDLLWRVTTLFDSNNDEYEEFLGLIGSSVEEHQKYIDKYKYIDTAWDKLIQDMIKSKRTTCAKIKAAYKGSYNIENRHRMRNRLLTFESFSSDRLEYDALLAEFDEYDISKSEILSCEILNVGDASDSDEARIMVSVKTKRGLGIIADWDNVSAEHATTLDQNMDDVVEMLQYAEPLEYDEVLTLYEKCERSTIYCRIV